MVVGALPAGFRFPGMPATDLIVPQPLPGAVPAQRKSGWMYAIGRLRAGQTSISRGGDGDSFAAVRNRVPGAEQGHALRGAAASRVAGRRHQEAAAAVARRRWLRAADGVRQRRQPDARASARPAARAGGSACARRQPAPPRPARPHRSVLPRRRRRHTRRCHRVERRADPCGPVPNASVCLAS